MTNTDLLKFFESASDRIIPLKLDVMYKPLMMGSVLLHLKLIESPPFDPDHPTAKKVSDLWKKCGDGKSLNEILTSTPSGTRWNNETEINEIELHFENPDVQKLCELLIKLFQR